MTFVAPWFLLGLLAAAIPLLLHLRRAQRRNKIVFSTTAFFNEQFLQTARRARLQDQLLMLLRMALFALFALALAQPLLRMPWMTSLLAPLSGKQYVAIVLDDSASMGVTDAKGRLLDRAKSAALDLIDSLSAARGDVVTVVLAGQRDEGPTVLFDPATADLDQARQAVRSVELSDLGTDLNQAVAAAEQVFAAEPQRQVYVLSDFAATAFVPETALASREATTLVLVATRPEQSPNENISIDAVQYGATRPMLGVPFTFRAQVTNGTRQPHKLGLNLVVDDQVVAHRDLEVPAGQSAVTRFVYRFNRTGWRSGRVEWDGATPAGEAPVADAIAADNHRVFAVAVQQQLRVLAVDGAPAELPGSDELFFFRTALLLDSADGAAAADAKAKAAGNRPPERMITLDTVTSAQLPAAKLEDYSVVLLANVASLPREVVETLERYVDKGGSLLVTLGDRVDRDRYNQWIGPERMHGGLLPGKLGDRVAAPAAGCLAWVAEGHPATAGFESGALGSLTNVTFAERYQVEPQASDTLMQTDGGDPVLLVKQCGLGRVMLFASTIDRDWTNLPLSPLFVPLVYRLVGYLAQPQGYGDSFYATGSKIELPASVTGQQHALRIATPAGKAAFFQIEELPAGPELTFSQTDAAGIYTVTAQTATAGAAEPEHLLAVNIPSRESRTEYAAREAVVVDPQSTVWFDAPEGAAREIEQARHGIGLWDALLLVALVVALFEPWLANRLSRPAARDDRAAAAGKLSDHSGPLDEARRTVARQAGSLSDPHETTAHLGT
ncbi:MAG TPA: VWA domain-containing protein [Pirellulales bacterium]|jgi:hypothetical protein|nr:VWA domain-containing protein [Pirellulales bacterium]